jgi:hypothetical protein
VALAHIIVIVIIIIIVTKSFRVSFRPNNPFDQMTRKREKHCVLAIKREDLGI